MLNDKYNTLYLVYIHAYKVAYPNKVLKHFLCFFFALLFLQYLNGLDIS